VVLLYPLLDTMPHLRYKRSTLHGIFSLNTILMGVGYAVVGLILLFFYPLNKKRTLQLTVDLTEKRKASLESINKLA